MEKRRILQEIGSRLKQLRKALRLSQEELAAKCGCARATYVKNESGYTFPGVMVLHTLRSMYEISLDWLVCNKGTMYQREEEPPLEQVAEVHQPPRPPLPGEVETLVEDMDRVPLLRHEMLAFYLRYKLDNPGLFDPTPTPKKAEKGTGK